MRSFVLAVVSSLACGGGSVGGDIDAAADAQPDAAPAPQDGGGNAGGDPFERCKAQSRFDLACAEEGSQVIVSGPKIGCFAVKSYATTRFQLMVDSSFSVQRARLGRPGDVGGKDGTIYDFVPPAPVGKDTPIPKQVKWPAKIVSHAFGGAFSFLEAEYLESDLTLDAPLTLAEAGSEKMVEGRFFVKGGTYVRADKNGQRYTVADPDARGEGCFRVRSSVRTQ